MATGKRKRREPRHDRKRTKETLSESPVRVAIATTPSIGGEGRRTLDLDTELTKAALLYADEVELVSLAASMVHELNQVADAGELGGYGLLSAMDDETLNHILAKTGRTLPADWRRAIGAALAIPPGGLATVGMEGDDQLEEWREMAANFGRRTQEDLAALIEDQGGAELLAATRSGAVKVASLGMSPASTLRPADLPSSGSSDAQLWNWIDALVERLNDKKTRLLFDKQAAGITQSMLDAGLIPSNPQGLRLAAQAALGAGFTERLPAFPNAKMDELLDMRKELELPLARYRGAVSRFSKAMPQAVSDDLDFEVEQLWIETVRPVLLGLEDELADHGLVRELARAVKVKDVRDFGSWTASTVATVTTTSLLDELTTGLIASAASGAATLALSAVHARQAGRENPKANEFYYLYEANRRLA